MKDEAHVKRVNGVAHGTLVPRFRVKGFPSFYLVHDGRVWSFNGPHAHDALVEFVRSRGTTHGSQLKMMGGPLSPYWKFVTRIFQEVDRVRTMASAYKDRPLTLVAIVISTLVCFLVSLACTIHFITRPPTQSRRTHTD